MLKCDVFAANKTDENRLQVRAAVLTSWDCTPMYLWREKKVSGLEQSDNIKLVILDAKRTTRESGVAPDNRRNG